MRHRLHFFLAFPGRHAWCYMLHAQLFKILTITLPGGYYYPFWLHFTGEETKSLNTGQIMKLQLRLTVIPLTVGACLSSNKWIGDSFSPVFWGDVLPSEPSDCVTSLGWSHCQPYKEEANSGTMTGQVGFWPSGGVRRQVAEASTGERFLSFAWRSWEPTRCNGRSALGHSVQVVSLYLQRGTWPTARQEP